MNASHSRCKHALDDPIALAVLPHGLVLRVRDGRVALLVGGEAAAMARRVAAYRESAYIPPELCNRASEHRCDIYARVAIHCSACQVQCCLSSGRALETMVVARLQHDF